MSWLLDPFTVAIVVGLLFIIMEVVVMQMTTFWFLYIGLGSLITAGVLKFLPDLGWVPATGIFIVATLLITAVINRPLRKWQNAPSPISGNDAVGQRVEVVGTVSQGKRGKVLWSGSEWTAELGPNASGTLQPGERARIVSVHDITLVVE